MARSIGDALGREALHQGAHDGVAARIPAGRDDADGVMGLGDRIERGAQVADLRVDVEAVHGVDAQREILQGRFLHLAGRGGEDGDVHLAQFRDIRDDGQGRQFGETFFRGVAAHDARTLHVRGRQDGLQRGLADIAIAHDRYSDLFHLSSFYRLYTTVG